MNLQELAALEVLGADGGAVRLGDRFGAGLVLLVFVRHFGCTGCSQNVADLRPRLTELAELGVTTLIVGNGSPLQLAGFVERFRLAEYPVEVLTDPSLRVHAAAELPRSWWRTLGPRGLRDLVQGAARGHLNGLPRGSASQQGGTFLYGPEVAGERPLLVAHANRSLADHLPAVELVDAALRVRARARDLA